MLDGLEEKPPRVEMYSNAGESADKAIHISVKEEGAW